MKKSTCSGHSGSNSKKNKHAHFHYHRYRHRLHHKHHHHSHDEHHNKNAVLATSKSNLSNMIEKGCRLLVFDYPPISFNDQK